ncbi:hypothetical protein [Xanthomarina sp.]|uniref:hypothetical protein n=1 Tax=Xanthomarina sp. TaxID=1931211 RepID=UPI002CB688B9|nr:hypothetical protein [Xanthomarina sp.]HLV40185.1 hypothetical protein [Xanthomarina sp.]
MKYLIYVGILFFALQTQAQKTNTKSFSSEGISTLVIDGNSIFKIIVETAKTKTISIHSEVEGENNEHVVLLTEIKDEELHISSSFQPMFVGNNDKLSAHKLISIELKLVIPENLELLVSSDIALVFLSGNYKNVDVQLINGSLNAKSFHGNLLVNTIHGNIDVSTNGAKVEVSSKHGHVVINAIKTGKQQMSLNSINGNITVSKAE